MASSANLQTAAPANNVNDNDSLLQIADASQLEHFRSSDSPEISPEIRGTIAETALTGLVRYPWPLITPVLHRLLDLALDSLNTQADGEMGPPRPFPGGLAFDAAKSNLHDLLNQFSAAPFTIQRLCEVLLEPRKQYNRADTLALAIERLLMVTSTVDIHPDLPPPPRLTALKQVNENPISPYTGQPPAGPLPQQASPDHMLANGLLGNFHRNQQEEFKIFVGPAEGPMALSPDRGSAGSPLAGGEALVMLAAQPTTETTAPSGPPPMEPAERVEAEAFAEGALSSPPPTARDDGPMVEPIGVDTNVEREAAAKTIGEESMIDNDCAPAIKEGIAAMDVDDPAAVER